MILNRSVIYCLLIIFPRGQWINLVSLVSCFVLGGLQQALLYANNPQLQPAPPSCLAFAASHTHTSPRDSHGRAMKRKPRWLINSALVLIPPYWLSTAETQLRSFAYIMLSPQQLPPKTGTQTHFRKYWGHGVHWCCGEYAKFQFVGR